MARSTVLWIATLLAGCGTSPPTTNDMVQSSRDMSVSVDRTTQGEPDLIAGQRGDGDGELRDLATPATSDCETYCNLVVAACTGNNLQYVDKAACVAACSHNYNWPAGTAGAIDGNTRACRTYHAGAAALPNMANTHCPHAGPSGGNICGSWCDVLCDAHARNCTGGNAQYASLADCITACETFSDNGTVNAPSGNTVQCRIYHVGLAGGGASAATTHCPHVGVTPMAGCN